MQTNHTYGGPEGLENARSLWLFAALALTCCLAGVVWIVLSALRRDWAGLGAAIAVTMLGMMGAPLAWVRFGQLSALSRLVRLIVGEGISEVKELAVRLRIPPRRALRRVKRLLDTRFLPGYVLWKETEVITKERADVRRKSEELFGN